MQELPLVSVIMCVYNTPQNYLNEAVLSILNQTYKNLELLIVDDCSKTDLYKDPIFNDSRITILKNKSNLGPGYSRNRALEIANGKFIAIMDSDDISLPSRLNEQINFLEENPGVVACGTWYQHIGAKNNTVKKVIEDNEYYRCCLLFGNNPTLLNPSVMIRKSTLDIYQIKYDEELRYGEDYDMWVRLSKIGIVTNLKKVLFQYRIHNNQLTNDNAKKRQSLKYDAKVKLAQLLSISDKFTDSEKELFISYYGDKKIKLNNYYCLLNKILDENTKSHIYNEEKLAIRIKEQFESKILCTNNPFELVSACLHLKQEKKNIFKVKFLQFKNKIFKRKKISYAKN